MSSNSTEPARQRPDSALPRPRSVAGRAQSRLRLTSPTPTSGWKSATRRIGRLTGAIFSSGVWSRIGRLTTWIGAVGVAVAAFTGLVFTYEQYRLSQEGQVTDRFTRAVEQLGSDSPNVRLGGIYSLERLAKDSAADRSTIMEVLSAFIRGRAPAPPQAPLQVPADRTVRCALDANSLMPIDIQAALTVIGRRDPTVVDLHRIDLSHACLCRASLAGVQMRDADLTGTDLRWADFVNLQAIRPAQWVKATVDLSYTHLEYANLSEAAADGARFRGADMTFINLTGVSLNAADLAGATMFFGNLTRANLNSADLNNADLSHADLTGAGLFQADLTGADMSAAVLTGANLTGAQLTRASLGGIVYDRNTKWPAGFTPPPSS